MWQQNLARQGKPQTPPELMQHLALQLIGGNGSALPWRLTRGNEHWEGLPNGPLAANSPGLQRGMATHGLGIVGLDNRMARLWVERGLLRRILPGCSLTSVTIWCIPPATARSRAGRPRSLNCCWRH